MAASGGRSALKPLERAFQQFDLDPNNQVDWQVLAALLAFRLFDEGKRGRHPWTTAQQLELLAEVQRRKQKNPLFTDEQVCRMIARDKNSPAYFRISPRTIEPKGSGLVKQLRKARQRFQTNTLASAVFHMAFLDAGRN